MSRRTVLTALRALPVLAACGQKPMLGQQEPQMKPKRLRQRIEALAARAAPAILGLAVEDLTTRQLFTYNGDRAFPLAGAARVPILAAVMAEAAASRLPPGEVMPVRDVDLSPPPSAVADAWPGRQTWRVDELEPLARQGDTTALDLLTRRIGGPGGVNGWLVVQRIDGISVDRYQRQVRTEAADLASFRADWKDRATWDQALAATSPARRAAAERERQADPRDTATPTGMVRLLEAFNYRELFARPDRERLLGHDPGYLAAVLPKGAALWQAAGSAPPDQGTTPASHAVAIMELRDGRRIAFVAFLTASTANAARREALIADIGRAVLEEF